MVSWRMQAIRKKCCTIKMFIHDVFEGQYLVTLIAVFESIVEVR